MTMSVKIYYGMCGTFKATTIKKELKSMLDCTPIWSMIKPWKEFETTIFKGMVDRNNLNFAILHLCMLESNLKSDLYSKHYLIERGISDMDFYQSKLITTDNDDWIKNSVKAESDIILRRTGITAQKILMIQNDPDFISRVVLKEKSRAEMFPGGVDDFLKAQEDYIEFTKKYNVISDTVVINDAKSYIQDTLGLEYNENV